MIKDRRSVRSFKPDDIPEKDLNRILEAARWSPSAGNRQPLEMVIIKENERREDLSEAALNQKFISEAPVDIVVCANIPRTTKRYGKRGSELYIIQDTAAATQNIHLMAKALDYGTCWVGAFDDSKVSEVIKAPGRIKPMAIVPIGKPDETPETPPKRDLSDITHHEKFSG